MTRDTWEGDWRALPPDMSATRPQGLHRTCVAA